MQYRADRIASDLPPSLGLGTTSVHWISRYRKRAILAGIRPGVTTLTSEQLRPPYARRTKIRRDIREIRLAAPDETCHLDQRRDGNIGPGRTVTLGSRKYPSQSRSEPARHGRST